MLDESNRYYPFYPRNPNISQGAAESITSILPQVQKNKLTPELLKELHDMLYLAVKYPKDTNDSYWLSLQQLYTEVKGKYEVIKNKNDQAIAEESQFHIKNTTTLDKLKEARIKLNSSYEYCKGLIVKNEKQIAFLSNILVLFNILKYSTRSYPEYFNKQENTDLVREVLEFKDQQNQMLDTVGEWSAAVREKIDRSNLAYIQSLDAKKGGRRARRSKSRASVLPSKRAKSRASVLPSKLRGKSRAGSRRKK